MIKSDKKPKVLVPSFPYSSINAYTMPICYPSLYLLKTHVFLHAYTYICVCICIDRQTNTENNWEKTYTTCTGILMNNNNMFVLYFFFFVIHQQQQKQLCTITGTTTTITILHNKTNKNYYNCIEMTINQKIEMNRRVTIDLKWTVDM